MTETRQTPATVTVPTLGLVLFIAFLLTVWFFEIDPKLVAIIVVMMMLVIAAAAAWREVWRPLSVGASFALLVTLLCPHQYQLPGIRIGRIDLFPLILWTGGLVLTWWLYTIMEIRYRLFLVSLAHLVVLFLVEYFGYYVLGIRLATGGPSLLGLGIIHGTPLLHMIYVLTGPFYLIVMSLLTGSKGLTGQAPSAHLGGCAAMRQQRWSSSAEGRGP